MMNLVNFLQAQNGTGSDTLCSELNPILRIVGIVVFAIKIIVPIILIIIGMIDLAKAVAEKKEDDIKAAQNRLVKRAIAAVLVFLVATLVSIVFTVILGRGNTEYKECMDCVNHPFSSACKTPDEYNKENESN